MKHGLGLKKNMVKMEPDEDNIFMLHSLDAGITVLYII
jgi:hypothetical protein